MPKCSLTDGWKVIAVLQENTLVLQKKGLGFIKNWNQPGMNSITQLRWSLNNSKNTQKQTTLKLKKMKQVININYHGRIIPIEVTAFELLKRYTESLQKHFTDEEGKDEIINDIENRISELLQETINKGAVCITDDNLNTVIKSMGRPEDFDEVFTAKENSQTDKKENHIAAANKRLFRSENEKLIGGVCGGLANYFGIDVVLVRIIFIILAFSFGVGLIPYLILWIATPSSAVKEIGGVRKKLYRDGENKIAGGVCSGIANYFGINPWIPRAVFILASLSIVFNGNGYHHQIEMFSPGALFIYIICWLVIPEAKTTSEKLQMKGEKVDMNSIKKNIADELKGVQEKVQQAGAETTQLVTKKSTSFFREGIDFVKKIISGAVKIIVFVIKAFVYTVLAIIGIALIISLFSLSFAALAVFPMRTFLISDGWQNVFAWGILLFFILVPVIGIITWIIRKIAGIKGSNKFVRLSFWSLFIIGIMSVIGFVFTMFADFKSTNIKTEEQVLLTNPAVNKLIITYPNEMDTKDDVGFIFSAFMNSYGDDTAYIDNISIKFRKSPNDSFKVMLSKMSNGKNRQEANAAAAQIQFNIIQKDSLLILDKGIRITRKNKFRNQRLLMTVYVPVGKEVSINNTFELSNDDIFTSQFPKVHEKSEDESTSGKVYMMQQDGLHELIINKE